MKTTKTASDRFPRYADALLNLIWSLLMLFAWSVLRLLAIVLIWCGERMAVAGEFLGLCADSIHEELKKP